MYSEHAEQRMQQRGINQDVVETIIDWGRSYVTHGSDLYYLSKKSLKRLQRKHGLPAPPERFKGVYVLVQDGQVKTVAHKINKRYLN